MEILLHPMLAAQRQVLTLPIEQRRAAIEQMLQPFEPMLKLITPPGVDPIAMGGFLRPEGPTEAYAQALSLLEAASAEERCHEALIRSSQAIEAIGYHPPIQQLQFGLFLLDTSPEMMRLSQGFTGFGGIPGYITVSLWPNETNLLKLEACVAHEFNHQVRLSVEPWQTEISVGEYIVMEGLAESFAAELYGPEAVGPWVAQVGAEKLATARDVIGQVLELRGFHQVRPYLFGDEVMAAFGGGEPVGLPAYGGYATGFHLVQAYLQRTGKSAAEATRVTTAEIIKHSAYFTE